MINQSKQAEEHITVHCSALHKILYTLQALDPEATSHAELERCKRIASRIKTALRALAPPARSSRSEGQEQEREEPEEQALEELLGSSPSGPH